MTITVLHVADTHFEDEDVYGTNYDSLEEYKEHAYSMLEDLSEDVDVKWFSGDCGTEEDWDELDSWAEQFDAYESIIGNSDTLDQEYHEHDEVEDPERLLENTATSQLQVSEDITYEILHSHDPRHVGIRPGNKPDRDEYMDEDENDRGVPYARDNKFDIAVTAHKHGEGSFVMEDGMLTAQAGSTAQNYITSDAMPATSVQKLHFDEETVTIEHIDFATGEVVETRSYEHVEDGFEPVSEDALSFEQRYDC